jgi:hypothetical protein
MNVGYIPWHKNKNKQKTPPDIMQVPDVCGDQIELGIDILMHKCRSPSSIVKGKRASVEDKH